MTFPIPAYASAAILDGCILSAVLQTSRDVESLVAKDASAYLGAPLAEILAAKAPRVNVLNLPVPGGERARVKPANGLATILISPLPTRLQSLRFPLHSVLA